MDYIVFFLFFTTLVWGMRLLKDFFSRKTTFLCFFLPYCHFSTFFRIKKDTHLNFAEFGHLFSPWTPIFDHFVHFLMMSVPKQPGLVLKSGFCVLHNCHHPKIYQNYPSVTQTRFNRILTIFMYFYINFNWIYMKIYEIWLDLCWI